MSAPDPTGEHVGALVRATGCCGGIRAPGGDLQLCGPVHCPMVAVEDASTPAAYAAIFAAFPGSEILEIDSQGQ